jgi:hypothetical protein
MLWYCFYICYFCAKFLDFWSEFVFFEAVFLFDIWVFFGVNTAHEHVERAGVKFVVPSLVYLI